MEADGVDEGYSSNDDDDDDQGDQSRALTEYGGADHIDDINGINNINDNRRRSKTQLTTAAAQRKAPKTNLDPKYRYSK